MGVVADISVVFLYVADVTRSVAFYRDVLGVPFGSPDGGWVDAVLPSGVRFALHESYEGRTPQTPGTVVVSFGVDDLDDALRRLRAAGIEVPEPTGEAFGSFVEIHDPDGYRLQLFQPPAATAAR